MTNNKNKNIDYREKFKGFKGACATCAHARSATIVTNGCRTDTKLIPYDGGKKVWCAKKPHHGASLNKDTPDFNLPINKCWEKSNI